MIDLQLDDIRQSKFKMEIWTEKPGKPGQFDIIYLKKVILIYDDMFDDHHVRI